MSQSHGMRQVGTKTVNSKIEIMKWNHRMDLLAISNDKGEVIVQRLNWQKIWVQSPPVESARVKGIDWRPDEKIIAIGYSTGLVLILNVENQQEINSFTVESDITFLAWTQNTTELIDEGEDFPLNSLNSHETYLPELPSFSSLSSTAKKSDYNSIKPYTKKILNFLIIGLSSGIIYTSVFGILPSGQLNISKVIERQPEEFQILDTKMSSDFRNLFVFIKIENILTLLSFENRIFKDYSLPLLNLATKYAHILNTLAYINDITQCIIEAWETVLLEMDNKLLKYASSKSEEGEVSADFLELLLFGYPSESLEQFLTRDLTEKGLKKLGNSIEISYSTMQKLITKPLHIGILNISFHLNCVKGMSENTYYYKHLLGDVSNEANTNAGAFLIKSVELQHAIEQSTRDYKIFWCWLYSVIIRLLDESIPDDFAAVTQQDTIYLAEFLYNFGVTSTGDPSEPQKKFQLERVGQYLQDKNIYMPPAIDFNEKWLKLLEENECLRKCDFIYPQHAELSLVQQHNLLKKSIENVFKKPELLIGEKFTLKGVINLIELTPLNPSISDHATDRITNEVFPIFLSNINIEKSNEILFTCQLLSKRMLVIKVRQDLDLLLIDGCLMELKTDDDIYFKRKHDLDIDLCHMQFYNESFLSILINVQKAKTEQKNCFIQFPIDSVKSLQNLLTIDQSSRTSTDRMDDGDNGGNTEETIKFNDVTKTLLTLDFYEYLDVNLFKDIDGFKAQFISVSGNRKIATILSNTQKRIRIYDMEVEEDEDDPDLVMVSNLDISKESNQSDEKK